jgi:DNA mismatch endonuclease, patch repair protein
MARPAASSDGVLRRMQQQRRRDTEPEVLLRRELHRLGLRYRVDHLVLPTVRRRADIVFSRAKVAVFVDGCFWHSCPVHATRPKANAEWWAEKLTRTVERDRDTDSRLTAAGWLVLRIWEHEDVVLAAQTVRTAVRTSLPRL